MLATTLLQRLRRADREAGVWEAADLQWWSRMPRDSDAIEQVFFLDEHGPVAGVNLTRWGEQAWQCDPVLVPGASGPDLAQVWARARAQIETQIETQVGDRVVVPVRDDDRDLTELVTAAGMDPGERDDTAWLDVHDRPAVQPVRDGFVLVDRGGRSDISHPMVGRSGPEVASRLGRCSLYDPTLDLAVETADGRVAAYSLFWFDPVTRVGLVEPVRVEDDFQRLGLARAMLTAGIDRLAERGATQVKISFSSEAAGNLYTSTGFCPTSHACWYVGTLGG